MLIVFVGNEYLYAQIHIPKVIPPSPQSQIIDKYADHPVTEYNGLAEITIPLYEIKLKELTIPITLSYHAGGIRYNSECDYMDTNFDARIDGEFGAGWSITSIGAHLSRKINGKPDEDFSFYDEAKFNQLLAKGNRLDIDKYLAGINYYTRSQTLTIEPSSGYLDGEPDLFTYNLPTTIGHFIKDKTKGKNISLEQNNDRIDLKSDFRSCTIIDDQGNSFELGGKDINGVDLVETVTEGSLLKPVPSTLRLSKIVTPNNEEISFTYNSAIRTVSTASKGIRISEASTLLKHPDNGKASEAVMNDSRILSLGSRYYTELCVNKIITENEIITITRGQDGVPRNIINSITITAKNGQFIKKILFNYIHNLHTLLESIQIVDKKYEAEKIFRCEYYNGLRSTSGLNATSDQWGYYNDARWSPSFSSPDHKAFVHSEFLDNIILDNVIIGRIGNSNLNGLIRTSKSIKDSRLYGSFQRFTINRSENLSPHYYSLRKIIYPTGGTVEYIYEPHQYKELNSKDIIIGGGQRIKKIIMKESTSSFPNVIEYIYGKNGNGLGVANFKINSSKFIDTQINISKTNVQTGSNLSSPDCLINVSKIYSTNPYSSEYSDFQVSYEYVTCKKYEERKNNLGQYIIENGHTYSKYLIPNNYTEGVMFPSIPNGVQGYSYSFNCYRIESYRIGYKPLLEYKEVYDAKDQLLLKEKYSYAESNNRSKIKGLKTDQKVFFSPGFNLDPNATGQLYNVYDRVNSVFNYMTLNIETGKYLLTEKSAIQYFGEKDSISSIETYDYDEINRVINKSSLINNRQYSEKYTYPTPSNGGGGLLSKNMLATQMEVTKMIDGVINNRLRYVYNNSIFPSKIETSYLKGDQFETEITFDKYDNKGNLLQYTTRDGLITTYLWSYNQRLPIAEIKNASQEEIKQYLGTSIDQLASTNNPNISLVKKLQEDLPQSMVSIYEYNHFKGLSTMTNISGLSTFYTYNSFNNLETIKNNEGKKIVDYFYNYANLCNEKEDTTNLDINLVEMDMPINKTYGINKTLKPFYVRIEGTGSYNLSWTLKDSHGNILDKLDNSNTPYFQISRMKEVGIKKLRCVVTDNKNQKTRIFEKEFEAIIEPILPYTITTSNSFFIVGGTANLETSYVEGGSGNFTYVWDFHKSGTSYKEVTTENNSISYLLEDNKYSFVVCKVYDKITKKQYGVAFNLGIVQATLEFRDIRKSRNRLDANLYCSGEAVNVTFIANSMSMYGPNFVTEYLIGGTSIVIYGAGTQSRMVRMKPGPNSISIIRHNIYGQENVPVNVMLQIDKVPGFYLKTSSLNHTLN